MTDFDYDVMQKKNIARSAFSKRSGSKSRKCTLPCDYMTQSQIKKLSGEIFSMNINQPITWKEFKKISDYAKNMYIEHLVNSFGVTATKISEMMGVSTETLRNCLKKSGCRASFVTGHKMTQEQTDMWEKFCCCANPEETAEEPPTVKATEEDKPEKTTAAPTVPDVQHQKPKMHMNGFSVSFIGEVNVDNVCNTLRYMLGNNMANCCLNISCSDIEDANQNACGFNT